ncbi:MAG: CapA family protein [Polyangiaceae bacterium]
MTRWIAPLLLALVACSKPSGTSSDPRSASALAREAAPAPLVSAAEPEVVSATPAPPSSAQPPKSVQTLAFVGDISTSLHVQNYLDGDAKADPPIEPGYPLQHVAERLRAYDLMVGNLECVVSPGGTRTRKFPLRGSLKTPQLLVDAGFDVVNVANNHQNDLGLSAYDDALSRLRGAGLAVSGDMLGGHDPILVRDVGPLRVAIVGIYNVKRTEAVALVKRAKDKAPLVIAFLHWGDDFHSRVTESQRTIGRAIIDAGAECVVGAHAHVVQPEETYQGKLIAYGLGNFVFTGMAARGTHNGALLELDLDPTGVVAHRYWKVRIDEQGIPRFVEDAATPEPFVDPPLDAPQNEPVPVPAKI